MIGNKDIEDTNMLIRYIVYTKNYDIQDIWYKISSDVCHIWICVDLEHILHQSSNGCSACEN